MQKKLLSLAIAGALAIPGAAMADVTSKSGGDITIYGKFHASWDFVDNDHANGNDDTDDNTGAFRNSRLGFKGSEDLGGGLKAIWQIETGLNTAPTSSKITVSEYVGKDGESYTRAKTTKSSGNEVFMRNTYVGLASESWGRVFFGKHDTPYKTATAKLDLFSDMIADYNNIIGNHMYGSEAKSNFNERLGQLVAYETPKVNGFKAQFARSSFQNNEDIEGIDEETEAWSAMAMYDQGPLFASVAYEVYSGEGWADVDNSTYHIGDDPTDNEEMDAWKLGLGYTFGDSKLAFVYEDIDHDSDTDKGKRASRDAFWGAFSHKFGANVFKLAYGKADDSDLDGSDDGAENWSVGLDHNFSKRTKLYAIYTHMDNDDDGRYDLYAGQNKGDTDYDAEAGGDDVSAFSLGIIHTF